MKKIVFIYISIIIVCISILGIHILKKYISQNDIYVLSGVNKINYLSSNNYKYTDINHNIDTTLFISNINNRKIYAPICNKNQIAVFQHGKFQKNIDLTYSLPLMAKYNIFDNNTYVFHKTKVTYKDENCITVIDSKKDIEKYNIKYNKGIEDITFTENKKMIVSSWSLDNDSTYNIDIFDLKNFSLIKTLKVSKMFNRISAVSNDLIYGLDRNSEKPYIYVISISKGKIINKIKLNYNNPYNIYIDNNNDKKHVYVLHQNFDLQEGKGVSIIDYNKHKVIGSIPDIYSPESMYIINDKLFISSLMDNKIYVVNKNNNYIEKEIHIRRPILPS
ncbi:hypothetical protein IRP63_07100 [Clostridium botulinum]|uniref:YncE family protein n=2 Tax=Clostridium botulinum TaxID=1491 RepID=UPI0004D6FE3B|nr:hypothetical protein [Clostridium botulinum]KEI07049.1 hypothetical protein Z952_02070 [Clostridium botulinum C/D str. BKT75002]KEI12126.1 hypothetical protein Z954_06215 [Clostridium botulinum C/D str. BKT2873]KOC52284.1 hypothetical protein ADU89_12020 [Clostridium botulinum]KOC56205.1 hypothetical protein ADU90_08755 [Clostridium botulinum]MCD3235051.1 hypothetical protein [Clostridium botulinum D/C]